MAIKGARAIAAKVLATLQVGTNGSLSNLLDDYRERDDFPLIQELCFGACRWYPALEHLLDNLLSKPLKAKESDVRWLLLVGLYQLRELSIADYAVINESVEASRSLKKPWAAALVNAVLRNYLRRKDSLESALQLSQDPGAASSDATRAANALAHPQWLFDRLKTQRPESVEAICDGNNARPPMTLRVNLSKISRDDYLERLGERGIDATRGGYADTALVLRDACHVDDLPGFRDGLVSVQDEASQIVPSLLQLRPGLTLVDACAAPGGKTAAILERETALKRLVAIDSSKKRLSRVTETLARLTLTEQPVSLYAANAEDIDAWWDGNPIDRILLDAPCSATGVIRRHPDIKVLRSPAEVASCCESQQTLLAALWPCLAEDGLLLYTTCSVLDEENQHAIARFLAATDNAKCERITADWGVECAAADGGSLGRQLLPIDPRGPDGFFFALLRKTSEPESKTG